MKSPSSILKGMARLSVQWVERCRYSPPCYPRQGIVETGEVANLLGIYAVATSETDQAEGLILGCWAAMIRDVAEQQAKGAPK